MRRVSFSEFRRNLARHLDTLESDRTERVVTRQDHEDMVILPLAELERIRATLHRLGTPANACRLMESVARLHASAT